MKVDETLRQRLIKLAACAGDDWRTELAAIRFRKDQALACDGFVIGVVALDGDGPDEERLVAGRELAGALRPGGKKAERRVEWHDDHAEVIVEAAGLFGAGITTTHLSYANGRDYPDVDKYVNDDWKGVQGEVPHFAPHRFAQVAALADKNEPVRFRWKDPLAAFRVEGNRNGLLGVVMPIRTDEVQS